MEEPITFTPKTPEPNKDGGQAFPAADAGFGPPWGGMSLRDWFAGQALAGFVASAGNDTLSMAEGETVQRALAREAKNCAEWCYAQADAMLAAREARNA